MKSRYFSLILFAILLALKSCYRMLPSKGGGQLSDVPAGRIIDTSDVLLPEGYKIELVAKNLTFPTAVTFDEAGNLYAIEAGYSYGEVFLEPKLLKIFPDGSQLPFILAKKMGPGMVSLTTTATFT